MRDVIVLTGGGSSLERDVSLRSAKIVAEELSKIVNTELVIFDKDELPIEVAARKDAIIFPVALGDFVEDGGLQKSMDEAGLCYIGSDSAASALCMNKSAAKDVVSRVGVPVVPGMKFSVKSGIPLSVDKNALSGDFILKPNDKGSSLYVKKVNRDTFEDAVKDLYDGEFLLEKNIIGQDLTIGLLDGEALGVVKILPKHDFLDYDGKYVPGAAEKIYPADISPEATVAVKKYAELAYKACRCRDWARIDFMISGDKIFFLEINTSPGMTTTSLYPLSALAAGVSYKEFLTKLINLANERFGLR